MSPKPALVLPGPSNSGPSLLSTSAESISRAGSFPRTSLEPVLPRLSSIRALPRLSSASPSRRLSGSLSGSPKNLRLSFASPRRLVFPAGTSNQANQNDPGQNTNELLRSKSADPSASVKEAPLDLHRPSNPSHQQHDPHPSGASSSMPSPQTLPVPPSPLLISLNEFFEQAEIRFISLSQPRVRNYDQQEHPNLSEGQHRVSSFAQQIFAGMIKIPRLRLLESKMLGWELVRFEDDLFVFIFYSTIGVNLHLDPFDPEQPYRNVRKVELRWAGPSVPIAEQDEPLIWQVEQFFFGHLKAHFDGKKVQGRVRELVQQISSIWYHAHQLIWEITNAQTRFSVAVDILEPSPAKHRARVSAAPTPGSLTMDVRVSIC
ncbi:hypothetical protein PtB15_3B143 [Puccinia triticina]|nr:hypothetical protein PtB15_3B143 [Puccinia triticina]